VYRPPYYDNIADYYLQSLIKCFTQFATSSQTNIIAGDFNCPGINWDSFTSPSDNISNSLLTYMVESGFQQFVNFATRTSNILDLVFTDDEQIIHSITLAPPLGHSDHATVEFSLVCSHTDLTSSRHKSKPQSLKNLDWSNANFHGIQEYISCINWYELVYTTPSAVELWEAFFDNLCFAINTYVPLRKPPLTISRGRKCYPKLLRKLRSQKCSLWKKLRQQPQSLTLRTKYRDCVNDWRQSLQNHKLTQEHHIIESNNLGAFYRHINSRLAHRASISPLYSANGSLLTDDVDKAELLNTYFAEVSSVDNGILPECVTVARNGCTLDYVNFTQSNVLSAIKRLKANLSCGPDDLPPLLFKNIAPAVAAPLAIIFTQLFSVTKVPVRWKEAVITPVFKKGAAGDVSNYRPISLTCVPAKLMERIIADCVLSYLMDNNLLHPAQHGFLKNRSTCTNLLESFNDWTIVLQDNNAVTVVYIDFRKAFDTVSHPKLISKLKSYGISGSLLSWFQEYLNDRSHCTRIGNTYSVFLPMLSGIIQGSVIGPLLFLIFINDLIMLLASVGINVKVFADDMKVYVRVTGSTDLIRLQSALDLLTDWASKWQLQLSVDKCFTLNLGKPKCDVTLHIDSNILPVVQTCRDLGVTVCSDLAPAMHIDQIVAKAHQRANNILRCFVSRDPQSLTRAFITYVRPLLEYNSIIWSPYLKQDIDRIEQVQRRFSKRLRGLRTYTYENRLKLLNLPSLELRRLQNDLAWCYRIVFGLTVLKFNEFFEWNPATQTRGHAFKLYKRSCMHRSRAVFFSERVINVWNQLPESTDFRSLSLFTRSVCCMDLSRYLHI